MAASMALMTAPGNKIAEDAGFQKPSSSSWKMPASTTESRKISKGGDLAEGAGYDGGEAGSRTAYAEL